MSKLNAERLAARPLDQRSEKAQARKAPRLYVPTKQEDAISTLLDKLDRWVLAQPEWLYLMSEGRATRRAVAKAVAAELSTIPLRSASNTPNRKLRRRIMQALRKGEL